MIDFAFARRLRRTADKYGVILDTDLQARLDHVLDITRFPLPKPEVGTAATDLVAAHLGDRKALETAYSKALVRVAAAAVAENFNRLVRTEAERVVADEIRQGRDEILASFFSADRVANAVQDLRDHAGTLSPSITREAVLDAPGDVVTAYKRTLDAWTLLTDLVKEVRPLFGPLFTGAGNDFGGSHAVALAIVSPPKFETREDVHKFIAATKGEVALAATTLASGSHRSAFAPAALAASGVTFELADATQYRARVVELQEARSAARWAAPIDPNKKTGKPILVL